MKVLLINPKISLDWARSPTCPLGLLSIASYLIEKGHTVKIFDHMVSSENIENYIKAFSPDIVGLSVISPMASADAIKISKFAKKLNIPVVWGGHITSALPELVFKEGCVDFIVIGEGEITFTALLDSIENGSSYYDVDGLAFVDNYGIHINKCREFSDLSTFPIIDWSLVDPRKYFQFFFGCKKMIYVYFSKGCPAKCTFCNNPNFHRSTHRKRPPEHIVSEIEYLYRNYGIDAVNFADEYWNPGKEDLQKFLHLMKERNLNIMWGIQTRLGTFSKEELKQMHDAGCRWVLYGIESGCKERIIEIKKGIDLTKAKEAYNVCRELGITTQSAFVIGFPGETEDELKETVKFALDLNANLCPFSMLFLYPGSEMYDYAVSNGLYTPPKSLKEWGKIIWLENMNVNLSKVSLKELKVIHYYTQWSAFADKGSINSDSYGIAKKMIADAFIKMFKYGFISFFVGSFVSAKQFLTVFWYAKAYPKILKKYGLYKRNHMKL